MTVLEILQIEGIIVRLIPRETVHLYTYSEGRSVPPSRTIVEINGRKFEREVRKNVYGGKYFVKRDMGHGSVIQFNTRTDGIGDTIEAAYADFLTK